MTLTFWRPRSPKANQLSATATERAFTLALAEFTELKQEQRLRIGTRDGLLYATLAALAGVLGATFTSRYAACLLLAPPVCLILGWTCNANDVSISAIGAYLSTILEPRLRALADVTHPVFGWELAHLDGPDYKLRKRGQLSIDLMTFVLSPAAAIVGYWIVGPRLPMLTVATAFETALLILLARRIATWAHRRDRSRPRLARHVPPRSPYPRGLTALTKPPPFVTPKPTPSHYARW